MYNKMVEFTRVLKLHSLLLRRRLVKLVCVSLFLIFYIVLFYSFSLGNHINSKKLPLTIWSKAIDVKLLVTDATYAIADEQPKPIKCKNCSATILIRKQRKSEKLKPDNPGDPVEHDPTIDEGAIQDSYKWYSLSKDKKCTKISPIRKLSFVRCHRVASHTLSNIFYRYGENNGLSFALPKADTFHYYWPLRFHHSYVDKTLIHEPTADLLINIARNRWSAVRSLMGNTGAVNIAILRDPAWHFQSLFEYMDMAYFIEQIVNQTNGENNYLREFSKDPDKTIKKIMNMTGTFDPVFYLLKNGQLFDLGYEEKDYNTSIQLDFIIRDLEEQFDLVLIADYIDESLVLLQRLLCWDIEDMAYIPHRARKVTGKIDDVTLGRLRNWNKEDMRVYSHFNDTLWRKIHEQEDSSTFYENVKKLKEYNRKALKTCVQKEDETQNKLAQNTKKSKTSYMNSSELSSASEDSIYIKYNLNTDITQDGTREKCKQYLRKEKDYIKILKEKQLQQGKQKLLPKNRLFKVEKEGNFFVSQSNRTANLYTTPPQTTESISAEVLKL